jgi:hypothetical protein
MVFVPGVGDEERGPKGSIFRYLRTSVAIIGILFYLLISSDRDGIE